MKQIRRRRRHLIIAIMTFAISNALDLLEGNNTPHWGTQLSAIQKIANSASFFTHCCATNAG
jgi:hypothetical protein